MNVLRDMGVIYPTEYSVPMMIIRGEFKVFVLSVFGLKPSVYGLYNRELNATIHEL